MRWSYDDGNAPDDGRQRRLERLAMGVHHWYVSDFEGRRARVADTCGSDGLMGIPVGLFGFVSCVRAFTRA